LFKYQFWSLLFRPAGEGKALQDLPGFSAIKGREFNTSMQSKLRMRKRWIRRKAASKGPSHTNTFTAGPLRKGRPPFYQSADPFDHERACHPS